MRLRLGLRQKLVAATLLPAAAVFALALVLVTALTRQVLEGELGERLVGVAQATAATLPADRLVLLAPGDETSRTYGHVRERLTAMRDSTGAARIRVVDLAGNLLGDSAADGHVGQPVPELDRDRVELARVKAGQGQPSSVLFKGQDGQLYKSGYAPVRDANGAVVAIVDVDASARFFAPLQQLRWRLVALGAVAVALLAILALAIGAALVRPIFRLVAAARRIGHGDLESPVTLQRGDELGVLAHDLEQMRKALLARDRQLQMMLAGVAHEVRNPLGGMELYAGLLAEDLREKPQQLELLAKIRRELDYLEVLVEDFLDYARTRPLSREPLELQALVREIVELTSPARAEKSLRLELRGETGELPLQGDPAALRRVLMNLLKNAAEAAPVGSALALELARDGGRCTIAVVDEGPGIPADKREQIFEPFFTTKEKGTGLGLAFARKLVEAHGGTLTLDETTSKGARFVVSLPA